MEPATALIGVTSLAALASAGFGWRMHGRARRAEARTAGLRAELQAERRAACHDPLTGLPNRRAFYRAGSALIADPVRYPMIAIVVDLDGFKQINDRFGHAAGDQVLITVARRLAGYAGDNLVARIGGDEFAGLLCTPTVDRSWLDQLLHRLARTLAAPMPVAGSSLTVTASIGLVPVCHRVQLSDALHHADAAMYHAKISSRRGGQLTYRMAWLPPPPQQRLLAGPRPTSAATPGDDRP